MRLAKASIYFRDDDVPFLVTQTPHEVVEILRAVSSHELVELTLGNESDWNGKPLFVRAGFIVAVSPPKDPEEE